MQVPSTQYLLSTYPALSQYQMLKKCWTDADVLVRCWGAKQVLSAESALFLLDTINLLSRNSRFQEDQKKQFAARCFSENLAGEKPRGKPFTSVTNNFLHLLGFKVKYPPALLNEKKCAYRGRFHTKDDKTLYSWKIPLWSNAKTPNTLVCWLRIVVFSLQ